MNLHKVLHVQQVQTENGVTAQAAEIELDFDKVAFVFHPNLQQQGVVYLDPYPLQIGQRVDESVLSDFCKVDVPQQGTLFFRPDSVIAVANVELGQYMLFFTGGPFGANSFLIQCTRQELDSMLSLNTGLLEL